MPTPMEKKACPQRGQDDTRLQAGLPIRRKKECDPGAGARQAHRIARQREQKHRQERHEPGVEPFNAPSHAAGHHEHRGRQHGDLPAERRAGACNELREIAAEPVCRAIPQAADRRRHEVAQRPTRDDAVIAQDQRGAEDTDPAGMPQRPRWHQCPEGADRIGGAALADRQFGDHQGQAHRRHRHEVDQQEHPAAILAGDIGEPPDIAHADGGTYRREDEPGAVSPEFAHARRPPAVLQRDTVAGRGRAVSVSRGRNRGPSPWRGPRQSAMEPRRRYAVATGACGPIARS